MKQFDLQPGAVLLLGVLLFVLQPLEMLVLFLAASVHELGHLLMLWMLEIPVFGLTLAMTGPVLHCEHAAFWFEDLLAALSGPAAGFLLWGCTSSVWPLLGEISLFLSLLNLLPILPLDGGRALSAVLRHPLGETVSDRICAALSLLLCGVMLSGGILAAASGYGITFAVFAGWMAVLACQAHGIVVK